jgi:hypothetical protein
MLTTLHRSPRTKRLEDLFLHRLRKAHESGRVINAVSARYSVRLVKKRV